MTQILLATNNADKLRELQVILKDLQIELVGFDRFPGLPPTVEDADTLEGNAIKKALEARDRTGLPAIADDTGLEVFYLNGRPGVYSSRFAGPGATYADNVHKLLVELRGVPPRRRAARFRTVAAFAPVGRTPLVAEGSCEGVIRESPRGTAGFGYDPVFLPNGYHQTFAEMDPALKNSISHRARAVTRLKELLAHHMAGG
jgi:XTP/dITP diphosphohydrolase